jgi:hypothetical protein
VDDQLDNGAPVDAAVALRAVADVVARLERLVDVSERLAMLEQDVARLSASIGGDLAALDRRLAVLEHGGRTNGKGSGT